MTTRELVQGTRDAIKGMIEDRDSLIAELDKAKASLATLEEDPSVTEDMFNDMCISIGEGDREVDRMNSKIIEAQDRLLNILDSVNETNNKEEAIKMTTLRVRGIQANKNVVATVDMDKKDVANKQTVVNIIMDMAVKNNLTTIKFPIDVVYAGDNTKAYIKYDALKDLLVGYVGISFVDEYNKDTIEKEAMEAQFDEMVGSMEDVIGKAGKYINKFQLKQILTADDDKVYGLVREAILQSAFRAFTKKGADKKEAEDIMASAKEMDATVEKANKKGISMANIKATFVLLAKRAWALVKGVAMFVFDATTIVGVLIARLGYRMGKEALAAFKAIFAAFKMDVLKRATC